MRKVLSLLLFVALFSGLNAQQTTLSLNHKEKKNLKYITQMPPTVDKTGNSSIATRVDVSAPDALYENTLLKPATTTEYAEVIPAYGNICENSTEDIMLLNSDDAAYGIITSETADNSGYGDLDPVYNESEYKIPVNIDSSLGTSNIVFIDAVGIEVPAGAYDYSNTISYKTRIIGDIPGRSGNFLFEDKKVHKSPGGKTPAISNVSSDNEILMGSVATVNSCGATFTDDGGADGNYAAKTDENNIQVITFVPDEADKKVRATFTEFSTIVDLDGDALYIVNGSYTNMDDVPEEAILDVLSGDLTSSLPEPYISYSMDGALTFFFMRDSWGYFPPTSGWIANMDCVNTIYDDAGLTAILSPVSATSDSYILSVNIKNFGENAITSLDMKYEVDGADAVTETYTGNLEASDTYDFRFATPVTFDDYGTACIKVYTNLTGDVNADNDTLEIMVVYRPAVKLYAYSTESGSKEFVSFDSNEAHNINTETTYIDGNNTIRGGEYLNKELYVYTATSSEPKNFVKLSEDWNQISSVPTNAIPNDVTYDHFTETMYAIAGSNLYSIDKFTGEFTTVTSSLPADFMTIACDLSGQLYGTSADGGFYSIDKTDGTAYLINQTGYVAKDIHSMAFDHDSERLFWAYIDDEGIKGSLIEIDPFTGECVNLGPLGNGKANFVMLYTPYYNPYIAEAPVNLDVTPDPEGEFSCKLTWTNPALTIDGETLTYLTSIVIMRNGEVIHTVDDPDIGADTSWTDNTITTDGSYKYIIYAVNEAGESTIATQTVFVGCIKSINTFPWNVGFEENVIHVCWTQENVMGSGINWVTASGNYSYPETAYSGSYNVVFVNSSYDPDVVKLITPRLDITDLSEPTLSFWHTQAAWDEDQDEFRIYYKASSNGEWVLLAEYTDDIQDWTEEIISLPNASDDYYIAFEGTAKYGCGIALDDISVYDSNTSGIDNTGYNESGIKIYPNPVTNGKLIIDCDFTRETESSPVIRLYDLTGNIAATFTATGNSTTIDISHLPVGTYILKVNEKAVKVMKN